MLVGDEYFDNDEFREILAEYESGDRQGEGTFLDADDLTDIADYYNSMGNKAKANKAIATALENFPGAAGPLMFKAREALQQEDLQTAYDCAEQMDDKSGVDYCYLQAEILIAQDKIDEADKQLGDYYENIDDDTAEDFVLDVAEMYIDYGVFDKANQWLTLIEDDDEPEYKELLAKALIGMEHTDEGIKIFEELIDENPYSKTYWLSLATAQMRNEDYADAIESCDYAIAIDPEDPTPVLTKGNCFFNMDNNEEALKCFLHFNELQTDSDGGELNAGTCLVNLTRYSEAIEHLKRAEQLAAKDSPNLPYIYQELAFAHCANEQNDEAMRYIELAERQDYDHTEINVLKGHVLLASGLFQQAQHTYRKAIEYSDYNPTVVLRVIVSILDNGYASVAYLLFKSLFATAPKDFKDGYSYMALCCHDLHQTRDFMKYLKLATRKNPGEAERVLGFLFPAGMGAKDYYDYIKNGKNKSQK